MLKLQVLRCVDESFPGWAECQFVDAEGRRHVIVEKVPVLFVDWPGLGTPLPPVAEARCEILERWRDAQGRELLKVTTGRPDWIETTEGLVEFVVEKSQIVSAQDTISRLEKEAIGYEQEAALKPKRAVAVLRAAVTCREWIAALRNGHWPSR